MEFRNKQVLHCLVTMFVMSAYAVNASHSEGNEALYGIIGFVLGAVIVFTLPRAD